MLRVLVAELYQVIYALRMLDSRATVQVTSSGPAIRAHQGIGLDDIVYRCH